MDMNLMMTALAVLPALIIGLVVCLIMRAKYQVLAQHLCQQRSRVTELQSDKQHLQSTLDEMTVEQHRLEKSLAGMETQIRNNHQTEQTLRADIAAKESTLDSVNLKLSEAALTAERLTTQLNEQQAHNAQARQDIRDIKALIHKEFSAMLIDALQQKGKTISNPSQQSFADV